MNNTMRALAKWWGDVFLEKICTPLSMSLFIAGTALAILEVIRRYVFGVSFVWQQDFVVATVLSGTTVYFAVTQWSHGHIAVTAVAELLTRHNKSPRRLRGIQIMNAISDTWTGVFLLLLFYWGVPLISKYKALGIQMPSQSFAFWPFWLVFLIGLAMYSITAFIHSYLEWTGLEEPTGADEDEHE